MHEHQQSLKVHMTGNTKSARFLPPEQRRLKKLCVAIQATVITLNLLSENWDGSSLKSQFQFSREIS